MKLIVLLKEIEKRLLADLFISSLRDGNISVKVSRGRIIIKINNQAVAVIKDTKPHWLIKTKCDNDSKGEKWSPICYNTIPTYISFYCLGFKDTTGFEDIEY